MAVAFNWVTNTAAQVGNTQASLSRGANTISSGDFLLAVVALIGSGVDPGAISPPDGTWTTISDAWNFQSDCRTGIFYKFATSDTGPFVFTWTPSVNASFLLADYTGASQSGPFDGSAQVDTNTGFGQPIALSVSPSGTTDELICMWAMEGGRDNYTIDPLLTSRVNQAVNSSGFSTLALGDQTLSASGATGTRSYTVDFPGGFTALSLCLAVAASSPAFTTYYAYQQPINLTS